MEDDLELRRYIRAVLRLGWLAVLIALLAGVAGWGYASVSATSYQATTLLAVSRPPFALDLDAVAQNNQLPVKTFGELALSDGVLQTLHERLQAAGAAVLEPAQLRKTLVATAATDTGLLRLTVTDSSGERAAQIANLWGAILLEQSLTLYGPDSVQMENYGAQLEQARLALETADATRAAYQTQNVTGLLQAQLDNLQRQLDAAYDRQARLALLADDARGLQARLAEQDSSAFANTVDEAALLLLVIQATNPGLTAPQTGLNLGHLATGTNVDVVQQSPLAPLQIQINITGGVSSQSVRSLSNAVRVFNDSLATRSSEAGALIDALSPQILALQADSANANRVADAYNTAVGLAEVQYTGLAGQVNQAQIAAQDAAGLVRLASAASVPATRTSTGRLTTATIAALVGLIVGVLIAVVLEWWRTPLSARRAAADDALAVKTP